MLFPAIPPSVGPIRLGGDIPVIRRDGISMPSPVRFSLPSDATERRGEWIWRDDRGAAPQPTRFRRSYQLDDDSGPVRVYVSADVRYRLWINGTLVSRGPSDVGRDYDSEAPGPWFDDLREVGRFLHRGRNVVAAEVYPTKLVSSEGTSGHPGFKLDLVSKGHLLLSSDASWHAQKADDLVYPSGFGIDLTKEPAGWTRPEFNDASWGPCVVSTAQRAATIPSELPPPMEMTVPSIGIERPTSGVTSTGRLGGATFAGDGSYAVRYPRVMSAYVALSIDGVKGAKLAVEPNEADAPGYNRRAELLLRDGEQTVELPYFDSFSTINLRLTGATRPVTIHEVRAIFTSYPVCYRGAFSCDREDLNKLWRVCRWVTQICMQTHHLDSPHHQEPISDAGDYLIETLNNYYAFGDPWLARQDLRKIARTLRQRDYRSFHTSYSLLWLRMLMEYRLYSGDEALVRELAPDVHRLLDRFAGYIGENGLISEAPNYMFLDWVEIEGFNLHHPSAVIGQGYMTALYYQALRDDEAVCGVTGEPARAEQDKRLEGDVRMAFDRELWDPSKGLYRDGKPFQSSVAPNQWLPADKAVETYSTQVNALAVSCGMATGGRAAEVMRKVLARPDMNCQPYFMHFVFDALANAGLFETYVLAQMRRWKVLPDSQSFFEMWNTGDRSHAWNATPLFQMSGRILGVTPLEPGFKRFSIRPLTCGLQHAEGVVPTPFGDVSLSWRVGDGVLGLRFRVPKDTEAVVDGNSYGPGFHEVRNLVKPGAR